MSSENIYKEDFIYLLSDITIRSLIEEASAHPKFGLVTKLSSGKHRDMDYETFAKSIKALRPYINEYAHCGFNFSPNIFNDLRVIGVKAEDAVLKATGGVNTHKGIIFLLGVLLPSIVDVFYKNKPFEGIQDNIKILCKDILDDLKNLDKKSDLTYGERIYLDYGITGIRGVAKSGIALAFDLEKKYELINDKNKLVLNILLNTMSVLDDTVILHRKNIDTLNYVKEKSKYILSKGSSNSEEGMDLIKEFTDECIEMGISPGGSADIVTVVLILMKTRKILI
ncbi:MAG: triphosphoribosyl-dephospho-CoA synthase [Lachnospirales bacterium]